MKRSSILTSFAAGLSFVHAAPATSLRDTTSSPVASSCINLTYREKWLMASCLTGADATTRIESAVYLDNKVENSDGSLLWKSDGRYSRTCKDCTITPSATLTCTCGTAWMTGKPPNINSTLILDEHIAVYNGHLLSNLISTPVPPVTPSIYPIPSTFTYSFGGIATCPEAGPGSFDPCKQNANSCTTTTNMTDTRESVFFFDGPITCYVPFIYFPDHKYEFEAMRFLSLGSWEVLGYADDKCTEVIERIKPEDVGVCKVFGAQRVKAVTIRPAFNGDM